MCGQRLQGRMNSVFGKSTATLSAIEHSVTRTTRDGFIAPMCWTMPAVEPT